MAEIPLRTRAHKYLKTRQGTWINGGELERLALTAGYKGSTISREMRRMAEESHDGELDLGGYILRQERKSKRAGSTIRSVEYCYASQKTDHVLRIMAIDQGQQNIKHFGMDDDEK